MAGGVCQSDGHQEPVDEGAVSGEPGIAGPRRRLALVALMVLGVALAAAPLAFRMFDRAPKGSTMLHDFRPFMTERRLRGFQQDMHEVDAAVVEVDGKVRPELARGADIDKKQFDTRFSSFVSFTGEWPRIDADMSDLLARVRANVGNYRAVAALPSFSLFPWFFVIPGLVLVATGAFGLLWPARAGSALVAAVVLGAALAVAPLVFGMFGRAPKGARMMNDFRSIMTRDRVHTIQGYFGTMSVGEGTIRLELVPLMQQVTGEGDAAFARQFPAVTALHRDWVGIINDMTPMIGAMSDNVDNYAALRALPPFGAFPWFFVAPGAIVVVLGLFALRSPRASTRDHADVAVLASGPSLTNSPNKELP